MGVVKADYPQMELVVALFHGEDDEGGERLKHGDIISIRRPMEIMGTGEKGITLRFRAQGLEEYDWWRLTQPIIEGGVPFEHRHFGAIGTIFDKRRFCVPLERLAEMYPSFDVGRAKDTADEYQPLMVTDIEVEGKHLNETPIVFDIESICWDKLRQSWLDMDLLGAE